MLPEQDLFFESLYRNNFGKLKAIAYTQTQNMPVAEELAQEVFVVALNDYATFCQHKEPFAYLKKVLKYKILEYRRETSRYRKLFLSMDYELIAQVKAPSNPFPINLPGILETVRETLSNDEWKMLYRFTMEGASHRQIADGMGITVKASYKRLERIREKLDEVLPEH